ncbi:1-(5-phosphoribosyl)-5-amino-4-imidazole-carboxylate carboxylase [Betaproteobacteria bacterium]|nr:1-(5-phosphoribosyl)-5-amino-4-imidazole-carboxylate carboxylase [Betaproteobacteria bacterium]
MEIINEKDKIFGLLQQVAAGRLTPDEALSRLQTLPFEDIGFAKLDLHRGLRQGVVETIYGGGKTPQQIVAIVLKMRERGLRNILVTRIAQDAVDALLAAEIPFVHHSIPRLALALPETPARLAGCVVVASGGTSDLPVCEEAALTCEALGNRVERLYDVGVSGLHRLLAQQETLTQARVVIVVAGMEGALASVVGGLVSCPVIAVPTSVGYGASFGGVAALLAMLNSCASGVAVVNIDNGYGAGVLASRINTMKSES